MDKFVVPQFIDIEDKIMGPITVRQFVIMMVGAMMLFIGFKLFTFTFFIFWAVFWLISIGIIGFLRINGKPFHFFLLNLVETIKRPPIRVWNKNLTLAQVRQLAFKAVDTKEVEKIPIKRRITKSSLSQLALIADTKGAYTGEDDFDLSGFDVKNTPAGVMPDDKTMVDIKMDRPKEK